MSALRIAAPLAAALVLAACGSSDEGEIHQWMAEQRAQSRPKVQPIPEPKKFSPQSYTQENAFDPFSNQKLTQALKRDSEQSASGTGLLAPELARRKQPLESYPLDTMSMVGSLIKQGNPVALVKVDNLLYQVSPGMYLGQNYGKIVKVGESEVVLREIVQDAAGEWIERTATLQLQERSK
ncbi:pilus assembly protein PilP [Ramlibacter sp.]|uniref:pilus assembly protein PilP n=1 Tax=Ramlibacter sp. TaxID=1917967 RepID=UPI002D69AE74|nr:pilus assembly protein PilP [Ramlibacter sp.]HYD77745.1 pilus assembly protein PilP [Ramlibacter sp.]